MSVSSRRSASEEEPTVVQIVKPKLAVVYGRGGSGKSTGIRAFVERAQHAGRDVTIADADPRATLCSYFSQVVQPSHKEEVVVSDWYDALINAQAEAATMTVVVDRNGGDQVFGRFAASLGLVELLSSVAVMPVAMHFFGTDPGDVADLAAVEADGSFCPEATVLILNAGGIKDARPADVAFTAVREHPAYRAALARGAREIVFPKLSCMAAVNALRVPFAQAETDKRLGITDRQRVAMWRRAVEEALLPVAAWLP